MEETLHFLHLEDSLADAELIRDILEEQWPGCVIELVDNETDFSSAVKRGGHDLILADFTLPTFDGMSALLIARERCPQIPFIFVTGSMGEVVAIESLKSGAADYVLKDGIARLVPSIRRALRERDEQQEKRVMSDTIAKLKYALEQTPLSILMTDPDGIIEYVNPKLAELTGYCIEELIGQKPGIFKSGLTNPESYKELWQSITAGTMWKGEFCNRKKNGDLYYEYAIITPVKDSSGSITNYLAIKEDITERKSLEDQLRQAQKMEAIGQLAGGIAHDFNNILTGIIGFGTLIGLKMNKDDPQRENLNHVLAGAERAANLTKSLLAFSRKQVIKLQAVDLNDIITKIGKFIKPIIGEDIELTILFKQDKLVVKADSGQIEQVLLNLATNARDAMPDGGQLSIVTEQTGLAQDFINIYGYGKPGDYALITIRDSGCGMDGTTLKKLFEPFFTTKEVGKGTGLGLSIVYGIIKQHNGFVNVQSEQGKGTAFFIYLPLIKSESMEKTHSVDEITGSCSGTILLADDDHAVRRMTEEVLGSMGYTVITATDGQDAVTKFSQNRDRVELVVLDIIMPVMNGCEACEQIKKIRPDMTCIFMSGYPADFISAKGELAMDAEVIEKPFSPWVLVKKIQEALGQVCRQGSVP